MLERPMGVDMKGKADVLIRSDESAMITDLKTTAKFDKFFKTAQSMHYDCSQRFTR